MMMRILVDGVEHPAPVSDEANFDSLLKAVRKEYINENSLISSIKVDGMEIGATEERALASVTIAQMQNIEISTRHPREIAEETLQLLHAFTEHLSAKSILVSELMISTDPEAAPRARDQLGSLLDGLTTFAESVRNIRDVYKIGRFDPIDIAEADLASILADILEFQQKGQHAYAAQMLAQDLPRNFQEWRDVAIPALIQSHTI